MNRHRKLREIAKQLHDFQCLPIPKASYVERIKEEYPDLFPLSADENQILWLNRQILGLEERCFEAESEVCELRRELDKLNIGGGERVAEKPVIQPLTEHSSLKYPSSVLSDSPMRFIRDQAWSLIGTHDSQDRQAELAYLMSCLSELAYHDLKEQELDSGGRYKRFVPSLAAKLLLEIGARVDVRGAFESVDAQVETLAPRNFAYTLYRFGDSVVVAVRGTVLLSAKDWLIDINAQKVSVRAGHYHKGFADEARNALEEDLWPKLNEAKSIYFTGHSLGGAVASILALEWPNRGAVKSPFVFASPRFGSWQAAGETFRFGYRRPADPIPHLPPAIAGFSHFGLEDNVIREVGFGSKLRSLIESLPFGLLHHRIEGIRSRLGARVGIDYQETVFVDAIRQAFLESNAKRL